MLDFISWLAFALSLSAVATFTCCCGTLTCDKCDDTPPSTMRVTISGLANAGCTDCATLDGTYDCDLDSTTPANCFWIYNFPGGSGGTNCNAEYVAVYNGSDSSGGSAPGRVLVRLHFDIAGVDYGEVYWHVDQSIVSGTDVIDCNLSSLSVPFEKNQHYGAGNRCDGTSATADVTAIA